MKKQKLLLVVFISLAFGLVSSAQDYMAQFDSIYNKSDTIATLNVLNKWQRALPNDPEFYVAYFNYYANRSMTELLNLQQTQQGEKSLQITDPKTKKVVGYLNDGMSINLTLLDKSFRYIDTGISKFPSRLDMRFGEIYMLGKIPDYNQFTAKLISAIIYGYQTGSKWTWTDSKAVDNPEKFMLSNEQTYIMQLYDAGDGQLDNMKAIAETVLKYYPDNVENLSNLAITYIIKKNYTQALQFLLRANKIAPTDFIVLNNIAFSYKGQGDKVNAIKYYNLVEKYGDDDAKENAKKQMEDLQEK